MSWEQARGLAFMSLFMYSHSIRYVEDRSIVSNKMSVDRYDGLYRPPVVIGGCDETTYC